MLGPCRNRGRTTTLDDDGLCRDVESCKRGLHQPVGCFIAIVVFLTIVVYLGIVAITAILILKSLQ